MAAASGIMGALALVGLGIAYYGVVVGRRSRIVANSWATTTGIIDLAEKRQGRDRYGNPRPYFECRVRYRYTVEGREFSSGKLRPGYDSLKASEVPAFGLNCRPGSTVTVH